MLDRRQLGGRDEVLVHWACSWITREDYSLGRLGAVAQTVMSRTVGLAEQVLVQWAVSWEPVASVDQELLEELGGAPAEVISVVESGDEAGSGGEVKSTASGGEAATPTKKVVKRRRASRGW